MEKEIVNRVAQSSLLTLHPKDFVPHLDIQTFDLKDFLYMGMVLKEKDFRTSLREFNWDQFSAKPVAIYCSTDALIPSWAYMLVATYLAEAAEVFYGTKESLETVLVNRHLDSLDFSKYAEAKIVLKGCGEGEIPPSIYTALSRKLLPLVSSLMFGEACSAVPIYKQRKKKA